MKLKLLPVLLACIICLFMQSSYGQQGPGTRYQDSVFANYTLDSFTYSTVFSQKMDVYQPMGDTASNRPLIILAHGGSFTSGTREDDATITWLCADLAHKGYVTVSIDYRLCSPFNLVIPQNGDSAISEVLEAVSDGKAAVRYFYQDVLTNGNSFKVDTNNIYVGGNSAGGVLFMQYGYIDSISEMPSNFQAMMPIIGGTLQGNSGNPGYSSNVKGIISLAGGLAQTSFMGYCSLPIVFAQGTYDSIVPYFCGSPEDGLVTSVQLCGLGSLAPLITTNVPYYDTLTFPGAGHVPWQNGGIDFYMVDTLVTGFLYKEVSNLVPTTCGPLGIQNVNYSAHITLYPNPATDVLNIQSSEFMTDISITDETGRTVVSVSGINTLSYQFNTTHLSPGIYIVKINDDQGYVPAIKKVVIE